MHMLPRKSSSFQCLYITRRWQSWWCSSWRDGLQTWGAWSGLLTSAWRWFLRETHLHAYCRSSTRSTHARTTGDYTAAGSVAMQKHPFEGRVAILRLASSCRMLWITRWVPALQNFTFTRYPHFSTEMHVIRCMLHFDKTLGVFR